LGLLFSVERNEENQFLKKLIERREVDFSRLSETGEYSKYFKYNGSLTVPMCEEIVTWFLCSEI
jgi:carbonic anhydrase